MVKSFENFIKRIKSKHSVINDLIREYKLDIAKPLIPQIEKILGRKLSGDERQTIEFAVMVLSVYGEANLRATKKESKFHFGHSGLSRARKKKL